MTPAITTDPDVRGGVPCIAHRVPMTDVLTRLADGLSLTEIAKATDWPLLGMIAAMRELAELYSQPPEPSASSFERAAIELVQATDGLSVEIEGSIRRGSPADNASTRHMEAERNFWILARKAAILAATNEKGAKCFDCDLDYECPAWADLVIPNDTWRLISPDGEGNGLLCFNCMVARLSSVGLENVPMTITSGPFSHPPEPSASIEVAASDICQSFADREDHNTHYYDPAIANVQHILTRHFGQPSRAERACQLVQEHADSWYFDIGVDSYCVWGVDAADFDTSMLSQASDFVTAILRAAGGEGEGES